MKNVTKKVAKQIVETVAVVKIVIDNFYLEVANVLYSIKPKDYSVIAAAPTKATLDKYFESCILKHNPTCVFSTSTGRKSFEARRPMLYLENGKLIQQPTATEPDKVTKTNSAGKTIKVAQTGPNTIYVRTSKTDKRPYSLKPEQLEAVKNDAESLKYMGLLKHLPTCVEISLTHGLISTDSNRPMYELQGKKLVQIFAPGMEPKAEVVTKKSPVTKKERLPLATIVVEAEAPALEVLEAETAE